MPASGNAPLSAARSREFLFTNRDFERIRRLIYAHAGISLAPIKRDMVYGRLVRRLRTLQIERFVDYLDQLDDAQSPEWEFFVNALTTNLTSFFRENHHFEMLADFIAARRAAERLPLRIWCAAASTGEEPYSLAMSACEAFDSMTPPVTVIATDIDTHVLETARQGIYPLARVEQLSLERRRRFFFKGTGAQTGWARVRPELQRLVQFAQVNLRDHSYPLEGPFDAIFCRNVMIYFDRETQHQILARFVPLLHLDGLLFAGHSESLLHASEQFRPLGKTVYERADR